MENIPNYLFCGPSWSGDGNSSCCSLHDSPASDTCSYLREGYSTYLTCGNDCLAQCQNLTYLYKNPTEVPSTADWFDGGAKAYANCLNFPIMYGYYERGLLPTAYDGFIEAFTPENVTSQHLQNITAAVTHCLIASCDNARDYVSCSSKCSPTSLLVNSTAASLTGVSACIESLCDGFEGLLYANKDIVGIGVFSSYILQSTISILAWLFASVLDIVERLGSPRAKKVAADQREKLITGLVEFHKTQCFFSITLQIASLASGIVFGSNTLNTVMLLPVSTNGILPITFTFFLLLRYGQRSRYLSLLTAVSWILATIVFWPLRYHISAHDDIDREYNMYKQFMTGLSASRACGSGSVQSVCTTLKPSLPIKSALDTLGPSPVLWSWSSAYLVYLFLRHYWPKDWYPTQRIAFNSSTHYRKLSDATGMVTRPAFKDLVYWSVSLLFLTCFAYQFYLFSTNLALDIINLEDWGFGQVVAITIWIPPLLEYVHHQISESIHNL